MLWLSDKYLKLGRIQSNARTANNTDGYNTILKYVTSFQDIKDLQDRLKDSLESLKDCLTHDWLEEGLNFSLMKYYTDLSWAQLVNEPMERKKVPIKDMDEILKVPGAGKKCRKILIEGI